MLEDDRSNSIDALASGFAVAVGVAILERAPKDLSQQNKRFEQFEQISVSPLPRSRTRSSPPDAQETVGGDHIG